MIFILCCRGQQQHTVEILSRMTPFMRQTITAAAHSAAQACSVALKQLLQELTSGGALPHMQPAVLPPPLLTAE